LPFLAHSPFANHIENIIGLGSEKQVLRIAALRVIAGMANLYPFWDFTNGYLVCEAVSVKNIMPNAKPSISVAVWPTCPSPAGVFAAGFINFFPETLNVFGGIL